MGAEKGDPEYRAVSPSVDPSSFSVSRLYQSKGVSPVYGHGPQEVVVESPTTTRPLRSRQLSSARRRTLDTM